MCVLGGGYLTWYGWLVCLRKFWFTVCKVMCRWTGVFQGCLITLSDSSSFIWRFIHLYLYTVVCVTNESHWCSRTWTLPLWLFKRDKSVCIVIQSTVRWQKRDCYCFTEHCWEPEWADLANQGLWQITTGHGHQQAESCCVQRCGKYWKLIPCLQAIDLVGQVL